MRDEISSLLGRGEWRERSEESEKLSNEWRNGVFSLRPRREIAISERESVLGNARVSDPLTKYSRIQATFNERCNLLPLLRTRSSCGFQLIGPTIFDCHRVAAGGKGCHFHPPPISHISKLYGSFMDFARRTPRPSSSSHLDFSFARTRLYQPTHSCMPSSSRALRPFDTSKYSRRGDTDYF